MKVLFDTSAFLIAHADAARLGDHVGLLEDPETVRLVSAVVGWEIAIKHALGKLELPSSPDHWVLDMVEQGAMTPLPIEMSHTLAVGRLPDVHRDPFDRLLVATAQVLGVPIITSDPIFERYDVDVLRI